jgi:hypothetical protein
LDVFICQESLQWLTDISSEVDKFTSKSSFLLPKTPTVKRKLRKRGAVAATSENGMLNV